MHAQDTLRTLAEQLGIQGMTHRVTFVRQDLCHLAVQLTQMADAAPTLDAPTFLGYVDRLLMALPISGPGILALSRRLPEIGDRLDDLGARSIAYQVAAMVVRRGQQMIAERKELEHQERAHMGTRPSPAGWSAAIIDAPEPGMTQAQWEAARIAYIDQVLASIPE